MIRLCTTAFFLALTLFSGGFMVTSSHGEEIGDIEEFALSSDREAVLAKLIPGSEQYYYFHCLHYQQTEQYEKAADLIKLWIDRRGHTEGVRVMQRRQALLTYPNTPQKTLEFVKNELGLRFDHQRQELDPAKHLPGVLDPKNVSRETLLKLAFANNNDLNRLTTAANDWLITQELSPERRRHLLQRLTRPDYENLVELVKEDLEFKHSSGFGSLSIHQMMLKAQLDSLLKAKPELLDQTQFINIYLSKLKPNPDVAWRDNNAERRAHIEQLWNFVKRLSPAHNSLIAHVLYHRLDLDRSEGVYDKELFMQYIRLPRHTNYMDAKYMELEANRRHACNLSASFESQTLLPPVGNDEPLLSDYLQHFFQTEGSYEPYTKILNDLYLKRQFAEAKILGGLGDAEEWASLLSPTEFQALKDRIDLDFAATNPKVFAVGEEVSLDLFVKNAKQVIVKVYEINAFNYYRENGRKVDTAIGLDGLAANFEQTHTYKEPALRRVKHTFRFPELKNAGVYVIDFIGNGKSSRAVLRKGQLNFVVETSPGGHLFRIYDEHQELRKNASLWLNGHEFTADKNGEILTPFSANNGRQPIILRDGERTTLTHFHQHAENYALQAGFYVDRESLLPLETATVAVRSSLRLGGEPVSLSLCEDVKLTITATDLDGVSTSKVVEDFELFEDRESHYEFQVIDRIASLQFSLSAKVKVVSQNSDTVVSATESFSLNGIASTDKIEDLHLLTHATDEANRWHEIELLGKSGEPLAGRAVHVQLQHRDFTQPIHAALQTNKKGRVILGELRDIVSISATSPQGVSQNWPLLGDRALAATVIHASEGEAIRTPYLGAADKPKRSELSLLEIRGGQFVADHFDSLNIANGFITATNLPAGDYDLLNKLTNQHIRFRVAAGKEESGHLLGDHRFLELRDGTPLQIQSIEHGDETIKIQLAGASEFSRVHLFANRYAPAYDLFSHFARVQDGPLSFTQSQLRTSSYAQGRDIGDEYRYILERQHATKFPGNMLERPSFLLNPWALRTTATGHQSAADGGMFGSEPNDADFDPSVAPPRTPKPAPPARNFTNLDFLGEQSFVALNLAADEDGMIEIDRKLLGWRHHLHVVAVDPRNTVYRETVLPLEEGKFFDRRLKNGLDPNGHFTQQKQITQLAKGEKFEITDLSSSRFESYDSLPDIYRLYATLSNDAKLREFAFILNWPNLTDAEKREKYSEYACHELNFFIHEKDPKFFDDVVKPYLTYKKDKTYLDHWLLGEKLTGYLEAWQYQRLNIAERVLLGRKMAAERKATMRHIADLLALRKPNLEELQALFDSGVVSGGLDVGGTLGESLKQNLRLIDERRGAVAGKPMDDLFGYAEADEESAPADKSPQSEREKSELDSKGGESKKDAERAKKRKLKEGLSRGRMLDGVVPNGPGETRSYFGRSNRDRTEGFYIKLEETKEWVENNYYHVPIEQQIADLVDVNPFWADYIEHDNEKPFLSGRFSEAHGNFTEMMLALAILDLPFESPEHKTEFVEGTMKLTPGGPMIVFHEEILATADKAEDAPVLVSQNFYRNGDRYRHENNERFDKFVTDEFLVHTVYGCQIVVTNPTSSRQKLELLTQIPLGSLPVAGGKVTQNRVLQLEPYSTSTFDFYFYFPLAGEFEQYPVHVAKSEELVAHAAPVTFNVVKELSKIDKTSWDYVSQFGTDADVIEFLRNENLHRVNLDRIAFRMSDKAFYQRVLNLLHERHIYNSTLWQYSVHHNDRLNIQSFMKHADSFISRCGPVLVSPLLTIDPVERFAYQHRDYRPLVNARAHQLGRRRQILNDRFHTQYHALLDILAHQPKLTDADQMAVVYYLLLQDRVEEALARFETIQPNQLETRLQYDYFAAYLDFFTPEQNVAEEIAAKYANHPVDRWRNAFASVTAHIKESQGGGFELVDKTDRTQDQTNLAATAPTFDFTIDGREVTLDYQNIDRVQVNYYLMDIELLFSRNPFVQQHSGKFSYIRPNASDFVELPTQEHKTVFALPEALRNRNVLVEIVGEGVNRSHAHYSNSLALQMIENYGQVKVYHRETQKPLSKVYVKVYAETSDGRIAFYKDGYTDIRGRFDYTSLNTGEIHSVKRFSLLVLSDEHGAIVREAKPPQQ